MINHISAHWEYITCPHCGAKLRYHPYIIYPPPPTAPLECSVCGGEIWVTARDIEVVPEGEEIIGIWDWLEKNWKWVAVGGISLSLIIVLARRRR